MNAQISSIEQVEKMRRKHCAKHTINRFDDLKGVFDEKETPKLRAKHGSCIMHNYDSKQLLKTIETFPLFQ